MSDLARLRLIIILLKRYIRTNSIQERNITLLTTLIDEIAPFLPIANSPFAPARLVRITINKNIPEVGKQRINNIKYLKYPPAEKVSRYGRCNCVNQSVLYGSFFSLTAEKEMRPKIGDLMTVSTWKIKEGLNLNVSPIFFITGLRNRPQNEISIRFKVAHENSIRKFPDAYKEEINNLMEFLALCFVKQVHPDNHYDYFLSAYIANKIFFHPDINIDTIIYPSVRDHLDCSNMAIKPTIFDEKFELYEVNENILISTQNRGLFHTGTGFTRKFNFGTGEILW